MAYIYKITNSINNKVYIGKTIRPIHIRFAEHKKDMLNRDYPLYLAFRKYGVENFYLSLIEEVDNTQVDDREKYWIKFYNSYKEGYNATLGGDGCISEINDDIIIELYNLGYICREISEKMGISRSTVYRHLVGLGLYHKLPYSYNKGKGIPISMLSKEGELLKSFSSIGEAARFLGDIEKVTHIAKACKNERKSAYGYKWKYSF